MIASLLRHTKDIARTNLLVTKPAMRVLCYTWRMNVPPILTYALGFVAAYKYAIIFFASFVEGPVIMIASGFLVRSHSLGIIPTFAALVCGDLVGDIVWYAVGRYLALPIVVNKGRAFGITRERFDRISALFASNQTKILLISKLTMGFGIAKGVLMAAGASRVDFRKFMIINFLGELAFASMLMAIGYLFSDWYARIGRAAGPYAAFAALAVLGLAAWFVIRKTKSSPEQLTGLGE